MADPQEKVPIEAPGEKAAGAKRDIQVWELGPLAWGTPAAARASLAALYHRVIEKAEDSIGWYLRKARSKRFGARLLRLGAIGLASLAGLMPLLSQLIRDAKGNLVIPPGWASVPMILAAGLIGLDKYFGCSTGWIRFISAGLTLQKFLTEFQLDWQAGIASWKKAGAPNAAEIQAMLVRARALLARVDDVVLDETRAWAAEFTSFLKSMEESAKAQAESGRPAVKARSEE
jgi:hypothetical protein